MLTSSHIVRLTGIALTLWALATACIHLWPRAFLDYTMAALGFVISLPMALLSVRLTRKLAGLEMSQLLAGVTLVGAIAMVIDGVMLRFVPWILWLRRCAFAGRRGLASLGLRRQPGLRIPVGFQGRAERFARKAEGWTNSRRNAGLKETFSPRTDTRRMSMRAAIVVLLTTLTLAACGTTHKTVVVQPPPNSTTVVDQNGNAHVIERDR